ncbi:hypothetical protein SPRG_09290 [Saprolegnia parasitica CBS 223.65]|uniref:LicD/FKTN/FKRP nucleotidyltransferase domain-containing protein n=1 Tax=Saprolegnia parasitica (strain CBS 223.65) TaxID=695850 RepID=A0A067CEB5_SAPPC|nr:hypothetical protein SPRG_09290 [Saprolegnia parasitica CBS 223.65]KDO25142.1 hypothetical protein SPRG_09290 [Saprolegnia parasitica CBS 223.65]|eukprot:XP_012204210.1 hypothetical protein SPRG_09290 [Saprolegnia parasitica CBS 223.65]
MIQRPRRSDDDLDNENDDDVREDAALLDIVDGYTRAKPQVHPLDVEATLCEKIALCVVSCLLIAIAVACVHAIWTTKLCVLIRDSHREVKYRRPNECFDHAEIDGMLRGLAQTFTTTLTAHGIEYWLDSGTLLGAIRTGALNPNDMDLDVGMSVAAFETLGATPLAFPERYKLEIVNSTLYPTRTRDAALPGRFIDKTSGLYLDIFVFLPSLDENGTALLGPVASSCWHECVACEGRPKHFAVPRDWIYPLMPCNFESVRARCPVNVDAYLTHLYGPSYRTRSWDLHKYIP